MGYVLETQGGLSFALSQSELNLDDFVNQLNDRNLLSIVVGNTVLNKNHIKFLAPDEEVEDGPDVKLIYMADGRVLKTHVPDFDAEAISKKMNTSTVDYIRVGDVIIHKYNINLIM